MVRAARLVVALCVIVVNLAAPRPALAGTADLAQAVDALVHGFPGEAGLWISDPNVPTPLFTHNASISVIAASLYKLGVLAEAERRVDAGELRYSDPIMIEPEDITEDGSFEDVGTELTLDGALEAMITISDNGSALALWHILGGANIDATLTKAGMPDFHVALNPREDHEVTPAAVGRFFTLLAKRQLISPGASDRMLARLERQHINNRLPAQLPDGVVIAHKTGNLSGVIHDAGIIYTKAGPRVVVAMTWDAAVDDADLFISSVGALVYSAILEPPANARYQVAKTPIVVDADSQPRVTVPITNIGTRAWAQTGPDAVGLIWELRNAQGQLVATSSRPQTLPALAPKQTENVGITLLVPRQPGDYGVTLGLTDGGGRPLAPAGAATATFTLRAHRPYLVAAQLAVPKALHRGEPSLLITQYAALDPAGSIPHALTLTWRALDARNGRTVASGSNVVGTLQPGASGTFFSPFVAPALLGTYKLSYELRERNVAISETTSTTVTIYGPRTYPDDQGDRVPTTTPTPTPSPRFTFAPLPLPSLSLPPLPLPKGKTPAPSPSP